MKFKTIFVLTIFLCCVKIASQWQTDVRLTNNSAYSSTYYNNSLSVAADGNSVHVVWTDLRDGNNEIYYKRSTNSGTSWDADLRLTDNSSASWNTSLSILGSVLHVIWIDDRDGNWEIYYKRSSDGGTSWGADTRLSNNSFYSEFPSVSVSASAVHVVWTDNREGNYEIYYMRSTDGGASWGPETRLTTNASFSLTPSVNTIGSAVHVVWRDNRDGNYEIYYKRSTDGGLSWGTDTRLVNNIFDSGDPSISAAGSVIITVWMDSRDGNWRVYSKRSTDGGSTWGADIPITENPADPAYPLIFISSQSAHFVWQDYRDGNYEIYYKRSTDAGLTWGADTRLTNNTAVSEIPSMYVNGSAVHTIWTDERDGNREIYYKRDPSGNPVGLNNPASGIPEKFSLSQNYPNPFNPTTKIKFSIPLASVRRTDIVLLTIYDNLGREIAELVNQQLSPGTYEADFEGSKLSTGIYYYRLTAGDFTETKKMVLVK